MAEDPTERGMTAKAGMDDPQRAEVRGWLRTVLRDDHASGDTVEAARHRHIRDAARHRRGSAPSHRDIKPRVSIAGFLFWAPRLIALLSLPPALAVLLLLAKDGDWRGPVTATIYGFFTLGWTLRHGLSRRQWAKGTLTGINEVTAHFGRLLMWFAVAIVAGWSAWWLLDLITRTPPA